MRQSGDELLERDPRERPVRMKARDVGAHDSGADDGLDLRLGPRAGSFRSRGRHEDEQRGESARDGEAAAHIPSYRLSGRPL